MKLPRLWAQIQTFAATLVAMLVLGLSAAYPAGAQDLPTSSEPATGNWTKMQPSSFAGTIKSAYEQCQRNADHDETDILTRQTCQEFRNFLEHGLCEVVMVPDGIVHDFMNGRTNGKSRITRNVKKQIGRNDRAFLCDLGDGVYGYWYTGIRNQSCNNVAFSFVKRPAPPPVILPPPVVTPPPPPPKRVMVVEEKCRFVKRETVQLPNTLTHVSDFEWCGCYVPGFTGMQQGGKQTSSVLKCD